MKQYNTIPYKFSLVEPAKQINIPRDTISTASQKAINWIQMHKYAYQEMYRRLVSHKHKIWHCYANDKEETFEFYSTITAPFGKYSYVNPPRYSKLKIKVHYKNKPPEGYTYTTHCNVGTAAFLYYYLRDECQGFKYTWPPRHPLACMVQWGAHGTSKHLANQSMYAEKLGYTFTPCNIRDATNYAEDGGYSIACWMNPKKGHASHVSTILGWENRIEPAGKLIYKHIMTYNIGAKNGYMSLEAAFGKSRIPQIKYYKLERISK